MFADDETYKFEYTIQFLIQEMVDRGAPNELREHAYKFVKHAMARLGFTFGGGLRGAHGACPGELLHVLQVGMLKRLLNEFFHIRRLKADKRKSKRGDTQQKFYHAATDAESQSNRRLFDKELTSAFGGKALKVGEMLQKQSDRNLPRTHFPQGIIPKKSKKSKQATETMVKKSGAEIQGALLVLIVLLSSYFADDVGIVDNLGNAALSAWIGTLELSIFLEEFFKKKDGYSRKDLLKAIKVIEALQDRIKGTCPRGGHGWKLIKFHLLCHLCNDIKRHGSPENFSSCPIEANHKVLATGPGRRTQQRQESFEKQSSTKAAEAQLIKRAYYELHPELLVKETIEERRHKKMSPQVTSTLLPHNG